MTSNHYFSKLIQKSKHKIIKYMLLVLLIWLCLSMLVVLPFRWLNPPTSMVMMDRWLHADNDNFSIKQDWLDWQQISKTMVLAAVVAEDQKFPQHHGFDLGSIKQAIVDASQGKSLRGASTISQQVAKNMYLWSGRSWLRKGLEVWFTLLIELCWSKQRILEIYLNIAEWGDGVFGVEAASLYHFNQSATKLSRYQQALLASCLPSPLTYNPAKPSQYLKQRAKWNLKQQKQLGGSAWLSALDL